MAHMEVDLGSSQNLDSISVSLNISCRNVIYNLKGPIILGTTQYSTLSKDSHLSRTPFGFPFLFMKSVDPCITQSRVQLEIVTGILIVTSTPIPAI